MRLIEAHPYVFEQYISIALPGFNPTPERLRRNIVFKQYAWNLLVVSCILPENCVFQLQNVDLLEIHRPVDSPCEITYSELADGIWQQGPLISQGHMRPYDELTCFA